MIMLASVWCLAFVFSMPEMLLRHLGNKMVSEVPLLDNSTHGSNEKREVINYTIIVQ